MIDVKPQVYQALANDAELVSLLGGKRVYQMKAPNATEFPRVTFFELNNIDSDYADDAAVSSEIRLQIDVWSKGSYSSIVARINAIMESLGFTRYYSTDLYEPDTDVYHKALRYITLTFLEG